MPLSNTTPLFKGFRATPPDKIDLQHIDGRTQHALSSLSQLVTVLKQNAPSTVIAVEKHWDQIWPWIQALSRCVLEGEGVSKDLELEAARTNILELLSVIFIYPIYTHQSVEVRYALRPLLSSTPQILQLSATLWLYASHHGYPPATVAGFVGCAGGLIICHSFYRPNEGAPKPFLDVLGSTKYDISAEIIKSLAQHLLGPNASYERLLAPILILCVSQHHPDPDCRESCLRKGVIRWIGLVVRRLTRGKKVKLHFDPISTCVGQGMLFLVGVVRSNPLGALEALDVGIIPAIVRARDYLLEDAIRRPEDRGTVGSASELFKEFLELIRRRLLFRRIMLRVVRAVRVIRKMELPDDFLDGCENVKMAWSKLEVEAERRLRIYKSEDRVANTYGERICGALFPRRSLNMASSSAQAAYVRFTVRAFARRRTGKRNIVTNANNKSAIVWHSRVLGLSNLSKLDIAYVTNQISYDFHHANRSHIKNLSPTADPSQYVVKVDYTKGDLEPAMEVLTREQYFQLLGYSSLKIPGRPMPINFRPTDKTPPAVACFPWTGDTVKMWDIVSDKKGLRQRT